MNTHIASPDLIRGLDGKKRGVSVKTIEALHLRAGLQLCSGQHDGPFT